MMSFPIRARSLSALLLPAVLALTACQAPALDEQDSATAHAQQAAEAAKAPADEAGKATEAPPVGTCDASQVQSLVARPTPTRWASRRRKMPVPTSCAS